MKNIIINLIILFLGYLIGRAGHFFFGDKIDFLHHWIYGLIILAIGIAFFQKPWEIYLISFGFSLTLSDLNDLLHFKFFGRDKLKIKKFWGVD